MTDLFMEMNAYDVRTRIEDEGRVPLQPLVHVHELEKGGVVFEDENVRVRAVLVDHPPVVPAFGYRFDAADRSIVISGDTKPSENLIALAQGAGVNSLSDRRLKQLTAADAAVDRARVFRRRAAGCASTVPSLAV